MMNLPASETDTTARGSDKRQWDGRRAWMNHSIYSADRTTHLKIVVVALVAGIAVAGFSISAHTSNSDEGYTQTARVMKVGKPVTVTSSGTSVVR
jgi:hypothetical protein